MGAPKFLVAIYELVLACLQFLLGRQLFFPASKPPPQNIITDHDGTHPIAVIIPCYKEGNTVAKTITHLLETST